jgi:hypothetical protein
MKKIIIFAILICGMSLYGYEDNTHQKLTEQAIKVAIEQGGLPEDFFLTTQKTSIANGAGAPKDAGKNAGEDYTDYKIKE